MLRKVGKTLVGVAAGVALAASNTFAVTIDTTSASADVTAAASAIVGVLLLIWAARRVFGFLGK